MCMNICRYVCMYDIHTIIYVSRERRGRGGEEGEGRRGGRGLDLLSGLDRVEGWTRG